MKLGITGSRSITRFDFLPYFFKRDPAFRAFCRAHGMSRRRITTVISGGARGIDTLAARAAEAAGLKSTVLPPDREKYPGRRIYRAYLERNRAIVDACDLLLAVWDGKSRGTRHTIACACRCGRPVFLVRCPPECRNVARIGKKCKNFRKGACNISDPL